MYVEGIEKLMQNENEVQRLREENEELKFRLQGEMTTAIYSLAKTGLVKLEDVFSADRSKKYALAKDLRSYLGIEKSTSANVRANVAVMLMKCTRVALYLIENGYEPSVVKEAGFTFVTNMSTGEKYQLDDKATKRLN